MRSKSPGTDVSQALREEIHLTGYYPEVVADGVFSSVGDEEVISYYVHHETTFDHEQVRRHLTVLVLTPSRFLIAHTDEHPGDDLLPQPYTSTTTEAVMLSAIRTVVITRIAANPTSGVTPAAEAVLTIGWGGVGRLDLEPASCADPQCEADHGYTGMVAGDDYNLRVSAAAEGEEAVAGVLAFAEALSARTRG